MIGHKSPISGIDSTDDYVATAGYDNRIILWRKAGGEALVVGTHDHLANQCRFSPSGALLVTSSSDYSSRVWAVPALELRAVLTDHTDDVEMSVISPDETRVATASRDHLVRVFDIDGTLRVRMEGHNADVLSVEWTEEGRELITSSDDGTVRRWDAASGRLLQTIDLGDVETDTIAPAGGGVIFAGNDEGQIVTIGPGGISKTDAHQAGVKRVIYDPRRRLLVTSSYDRTIRLWYQEDSGSLVHIRTSAVPGIVWLRSCAFSGPDHLVFGTFGTKYVSYDIRTGEWDIEGVEDTNGVNAVLEVDGRVYTVGDAGVVKVDGNVVSAPGTCCNFLAHFAGHTVTGGQLGIVFDADTGEGIYQHRSPLNCGQTLKGGGSERLIVGTYTGEGLVFELDESGKPRMVKEVQLHDNAIKGITANGAHVFSVSATAAAAFHTLPELSKDIFLNRPHDMIADGASVLPDGRFASVSRDRKLRIFGSDGSWDVIETPHENSHKAVAVDPASGLVATAGYRGRVSVYDPRSGEWVWDRRLTMSGISCVSATAEAGKFLASSYDGHVYEVNAAARAQ